MPLLLPPLIDTTELKVKIDLKLTTLFSQTFQSMQALLTDSNNYYDNINRLLEYNTYESQYSETLSEILNKFAENLVSFYKLKKALLQSVLASFDSSLFNISQWWSYLSLQGLKIEATDKFRFILRQCRFDLISYTLEFSQYISHYYEPAIILQIQSTYLSLERQCIFHYFWFHTLDLFNTFKISCINLFETSLITVERRSSIITNYLYLYRCTLANIKPLLKYGIFIAPLLKWRESSFFLVLFDYILELYFVKDFTSSDISIFNYTTVYSEYLLHCESFRVTFLGLFYRTNSNKYWLFHEYFNPRSLSRDISIGALPPIPHVIDDIT